MRSSSVPVPEWWLGSQDSLQAMTHAAPCAAHPALLLPLSAAYLPPTSVAMASVDDAASCVVELTCRDPPAATDGDLAAAPALPHLKALVLEACDNLTAAAMRHVSQSKTLEDLRLDGTPVDDDGFQHLTDLAPTLRRLSIAHCRGTSIDGFKSIASLRRLTALNLSFCVELDAAALSHVTTLDGLTELDVHGCHNVGPDGVASLAALSRLTKLDIGCCGVDDASLTYLSASPPSLKWLCLHKCGSVPAEVFAALPRLTHLDASYCTLDEAGVTHISSMAALTSLNLWRADGVTSEAFVKFTALTTLTELNLDGCQEVTAAALAPLAVLPNLTDVNTDDTAALDELDELIALVKRLSPPACPTNGLTLFVYEFDDDDDEDHVVDESKPAHRKEERDEGQDVSTPPDARNVGASAPGSTVGGGDGPARFTALSREARLYHTDAQLREIFDELDVNRDGFLNPQEFAKYYQQNFLEDDLGVSDAQAKFQRALQATQAWDDGRLCFDEFCVMMLKRVQW